MHKHELLRRFLASLAITAIFAGSSRVALAAGFSDTAGTNYEIAFSYLQEKGIVAGYSDGLARPTYPLNRVEALKVILESYGKYDKTISAYKKKMPPLPLFGDTDQKQWYAPYIETAFENGVITGYPDGTFRPAKLLTVEEAVTMLMRTFEEKGSSQKAELSAYMQNQPGQWYTPSINVAITRNLVMHAGQRKLGAVITRGEFFDMVYRLHWIRSRGEVAYNGREPNEPRAVVAAPTPVYTLDENLEPTGVTTTNGVAPRPQPQVTPTPAPQQPVTIAPKIDHPYASEKYFAISMPSLGIENLAIIHPEDALSHDGVLAPLSNGVGHLFAYPGGGGKIMIYGHSSGYPWDVSEYTKVFRRINELAVGDRVYVTYAGNLYIYEISLEQTVLAKDTSPFNDDGSGEELILYTCWPPDSIAQRYLVHAVPVETIALR
jgi:LPXTG-site transpeptidase (sortase) family protein